MKDLSMMQGIIKILEENTGSQLFDLGRSNFLIDTLPEAREAKAKMNYWDLIKIKPSAQSRKLSTKPMEWGKVFANNISDKGLVSKLCKELIKLNIQKK